MARRKAPAMTPEQIEAEAARKAEWDREFAIAHRRAARAIMTQPFALVGQDDVRSGMSAESMQWWANKNRLETLTLMAMDGVSDDVLRQLVAGDDVHSSDRMTAAWWYCVRVPFLYRFEGDVNAHVMSLLLRPVTEMVNDGTMHRDAISWLVGTGDRFADDRRRARIDLATQAAEISALAK